MDNSKNSDSSIAKYLSFSVQNIGNEEIAYASIGYFARDGILALTRKVVQRELKLSGKDTSELVVILQAKGKYIQDILLSRIDKTKFTTADLVRKLAIEVFDEYEEDCLKQIRQQNQVIGKVVENAMSEGKKRKYANRNADTINALLQSTYSVLLKSGFRVDRTPIYNLMSLLDISSMQSVQDYLRLSDKHRQIIFSMQTERMGRFNEIVDNYNSVESNDVNKLNSAHAFFSKIAYSEYNKYDEKLIQAIPHIADRLRQIRRQTIGPSYIFNVQSTATNLQPTEAADYDLSPSQSQKHLDIQMRSTEALLKIDKDNHEARSKQILRTNKEVLDTLLTEKQRALWLASIGEPIPDELFCKIYVAYKKIYSK